MQFRSIIDSIPVAGVVLGGQVMIATRLLLRGRGILREDGIDARLRAFIL